MAARVGLARDGVVLEGPSPEVAGNSEVVGKPISFIKSLPRGAYTAARTAKLRRAIFALEFHKKRLIDSYRILMAEDTSELDITTEKSPTEEEFLRVAVDSMRAALTGLEQVLESEEEKGCEAMVTVVVTLTDHPTVYAMATLLPGMSPNGVAVEVREGPRHRPKAKDTQWITERKRLEDVRLSDVSETILADQHENLLEGATSNFFVLMEDILYTAPDVILPGHLRDVIIYRICPDLNIPVRLQAPHPDTTSKWQAAFLTNAKRVPDWIYTIKFPENHHRTDLHLPHHPTIDLIHNRILSLLNNTSDPIRK